MFRKCSLPYLEDYVIKELEIKKTITKVKNNIEFYQFFA